MGYFDQFNQQIETSKIETANKLKSAQMDKAYLESLNASEVAKARKANFMAKMDYDTTQTQAQNQALKAQVDELTKMQKQYQGRTVQQYAAGFAMQEGRANNDAELRHWLKNMDDQTVASIGIKDRNSVGLVDTTNEADAKMLTNFLSREYGLDGGSLEEAKTAPVTDKDGNPVLNENGGTQTLIEYMSNNGMVVKADGAIVDMAQFYTITGARGRMDPKAQDVLNRHEDIAISNFNEQRAIAQFKAEEKNKALKEQIQAKAQSISGTSTADTRSTMGKELDDLKGMFPEMSNEELFGLWQDSQSASSGGSWDQRLIDRKKELLRKEGKKPGDPAWDSAMKTLYQQIETKSTFGVGENVSQKDEGIKRVGVMEGSQILDSKKDGNYQVGSLSTETAIKNSPFFTKEIKPILKEFDNDFLAVKEASKVRNDIQTFVDNGGDFGKLESVFKSISGMTPDDLAGVVTLDSGELQKRYNIDGAQAVLVGSLVKSLYGSAASNVEGQTIRDHFAIDSWTNANSAIAKVNALLGLATRKLNDKGDLLISKGMTHSIPKQLNEVSALNKPKQMKVDNDKLQRYIKFYNSLSDTEKAKYKNPKDL